MTLPPTSIPSRPLSPRHLYSLTPAEALLLDYFRLVCARDMALYFDAPSWAVRVLQTVHVEPFVCCAVLALAAASRAHYQPAGQSSLDGRRVAGTWYGQALRRLKARLDECGHGNGSGGGGGGGGGDHERGRAVELAVLGSVLFMNLEFLLGGDRGRTATSTGFIRAHLDAAWTMLQAQTTRKGQRSDMAYLESALHTIQGQLELFSLPRDMPPALAAKPQFSQETSLL